MKRFQLLGLASLSIACLGSPAAAQKTLLALEGANVGDHFGAAVSSAGDVDNDGFDDVIVGSPDSDGNGVSSGSITVFSGQTGLVLYSYSGFAAGDNSGFAVGTAGDVDGDGFDDFIAGLPRSDWNGGNSGLVIVFSGQTGFALYLLSGAPDDRMGSSVDGGGDVDNDGFGDFVVGSPRADPGGSNSGQAIVYSGQTGAILHTIDGAAAGDALGTAVAIAPDVDGDGFDDIIVGASGDDSAGSEAGSTRVVSGQTGAVLWIVDGVGTFALCGFAVDGTGDVDMDGFGDFIVGSPGATTANGSFSGTSTVYSGQTGGVLWTVDGEGPGTFWGSTVSGVGDFNGDGFADFLAGSPLQDVAGNKDVGAARLYSGMDNTLIFHLGGNNKNDHFASSVACAGDVDGDGLSDVILGADQGDGATKNVGTAQVIAGQRFIGTNYCGPAVPNVTGLPGIIQALGSDVVTDDELTLRVYQLPPKKFGLFLVSPTQRFYPNPGGSLGNLCLGGSIGRFLTQFFRSDLAGTISIDVDLGALPLSPPPTVMPGDTYNFTCWYRDFDDSITNFTDAISITFQ